MLYVPLLIFFILFCFVLFHLSLCYKNLFSSSFSFFIYHFFLSHSINQGVAIMVKDHPDQINAMACGMDRPFYVCWHWTSRGVHLHAGR